MWVVCEVRFSYSLVIWDKLFGMLSVVESSFCHFCRAMDLPLKDGGQVVTNRRPVGLLRFPAEEIITYTLLFGDFVAFILSSSVFGGSLTHNASGDCR